MVSSNKFPYSYLQNNNNVVYYLPYFPEVRIRYLLKKSVFYNINSCFLPSSEIWKKSLTFRRRTKLSTRPFIYHISVSGKLSLYQYTNKYKAESQENYPLKLYAVGTKLFEFGMFIVLLKCFCLNFMSFLPIFYLHYTYYSGLLIYCCQCVTTEITL